MSAPEKVEEDRALLSAARMGITHLKMTLRGNRGWPDQLFLYKGQIMWIEFKRRGERPTELQSYRLSWLQTNGFHAVWCDNAEHAVKELTRWKQLIDGKTSPA